MRPSTSGKRKKYKPHVSSTPNSVRPKPIHTISPSQYNPTTDRLILPDAAYGYEQGRQAGTLAQNFDWKTLPTGGREYKQEVKRQATLPAPPKLTPETRSLMRSVQLQNPYVTAPMMRRIVAEPEIMALMNASSPLQSNGPDDQIGQIMNAIGQIESTNNYGATNFNDPGGGAWGKYQILATNIGPWTQEALGYSMSPQEFLGNPEAQDETARYMIEKYYNQFGQDPFAVARAWNAGPGRATDPNAVPGYQDRFRQAFGNTTSTGQYVPQQYMTPGAGFSFPIAGVTETNNPFGTPNPRYSSGYHRGVDFPAAAGTPIAAITGGRVLEAGFNGAWGNTLLMADSTGQYTIRYSHMNSLPYVQPGQLVQQGQVLGGVGSTGRSTGNHLDLEIMRNGQLIDPLTLLR